VFAIQEEIAEGLQSLLDNPVDGLELNKDILDVVILILDFPQIIFQFFQLLLSRW
jgi:hypothetical protein